MWLGSSCQDEGKSILKSRIRDTITLLADQSILLANLGPRGGHINYTAYDKRSQKVIKSIAMKGREDLRTLLQSLLLGVMDLSMFSIYSYQSPGYILVFHSGINIPSSEKPIPIVTCTDSHFAKCYTSEALTPMLQSYIHIVYIIHGPRVLLQGLGLMCISHPYAFWANPAQDGM